MLNNKDIGEWTPTATGSFVDPRTDSGDSTSGNRLELLPQIR